MWNSIMDLVQTLVLAVWILLMLQLLHRQNRLESKIERAQIRPFEDPKPICGCQHHQCFHDESGCKYFSSRYSKPSEATEWSREVSACGCLRYIGPEALPTVLP